MRRWNLALRLAVREENPWAERFSRFETRGASSGVQLIPAGKCFAVIGNEWTVFLYCFWESSNKGGTAGILLVPCFWMRGFFYFIKGGFCAK
jgi:hypothetical protein